MIMKVKTQFEKSETCGDLWEGRQRNLFSWLSGPSILFHIGVGVVFQNDEHNKSNFVHVVSRNYSCNVKDEDENDFENEIFSILS